MRVRKLLWFGCLFVLLLGGCGGGGSSSSEPAPTALTYPVLTALSVGEFIGLTPTVTGSVTSYAISPALPAGLTLSTTTGVISGSATSAAASTAYTVTASNAGGSTTYTLTFAVAVGPIGEVKVYELTEAPVLALSATAPASGDTITATASAAGATQIDLAAAGSGCGTLTTGTAAAATLTKSGVVAASGQCIVTAVVTTSAGKRTYATQFTVVPTARLAGQGLSVNDGIYFPSGDATQFTTGSAVSIGTVTVPQALINGGSGVLYVTQASGTPSSRAILRFSGIPGYYVVPVTSDASGRYVIQMTTTGDFFNELAATSSFRAYAASVHQTTEAYWSAEALYNKPGITRHAADVRAAAASATTITVTVNLLAGDGTVSAPSTASLPVQVVGSGPIQVSLSWVGPVDVDLHVVPPASREIYYGNKSDSTGGSQDLDSNAGCGIDNVNNENIVWANSSTPANGLYKVRVDYWSNCSVSTSIPYTLRVTACGVSQTYTGMLTPGQADRGGAGSGVEVATFAYAACNGLSVSGAAKYDDYAPNTTGLSTTARALPIRYAKVEVHQSSNDAVLATGQTDENGSYSLTFAMATPGKYYVKVLASQDNASHAQKVVDNAGAIYAIKTPDKDASTTPNATGVDLNATKGGAFAEAFNIFDVGVSAFKEVAAQFGGTLPALTWRWEAGTATCGGKASCYDGGTDTIYVLSTAADTDEYDDTVLAHEFGHFAMYRLSKFVPVDGSHSLYTYNAPTLAWNEGAATFVGQRIMQTPTYIDTTPSGAFVYNLETLPSRVPTGTSDGTLSGNVSEATVSAVLWDLADSAQDSVPINATTYTDKIANPGGVFATLVSWRSKTHDRGFSGADLADFIDEWLCRDTKTTWDTTPGDDFAGVISKLNGFPYAPPATASCN